MSVAEELIVQVRTEGIDIAQDGLSNLSEAVGDFVEEVKEGSAELTDFIGGFRGALGAIVAGLAVVAGGLASQIPIVSELLAGLGAVATAVGLKIDEKLRPFLSDVVESLYDLSTAIMEADDMGDIFNALTSNVLGAVAVMLSLITVLAGVGLAIKGAAAGLGAIGALFGLLKGIVVGFIGVVAGILGIPVWLAAVVVAVAAFAAAWLLDIGSTREITADVVAKIKELWDGFVEYVSGLWDRIKAYFQNLEDRFNAWVDGLVADAKQWGKDIIDSMIEGIRESIPGLDFVLDRVGFNNNAPAAPQPSNTSLSRDYGMSPNMYLDGRDVSNRTARYRVDNARRRGL